MPSPDLNLADPALATDYTFVSLQFTNALSWVFVARQPASVAQLFAFTPIIFANAFGISQDQVKTYCLQAWQPAGFSGDPDQLLTLWLGFIPNAVVSTLIVSHASLPTEYHTDIAQFALQADLPVRNSPLYTAQSGIAAQLVGLINPGFSPLSMPSSNPLSGNHKPNNSNGGSLSSNNLSRRNAIIGVCVAFGALGLLVIIWWLVRAIMRHQAAAHRPLDDGGGGYGSMAQAQPLGVGSSAAATRAFSPDSGEQNPFASPPGSIERHDGAVEAAGVHRRSFFFAEDELRGYEDVNREVESESPPPVSGVSSGTTFYSSHRPPSTYRRGQITPGVISAPILRESSLNW